MRAIYSKIILGIIISYFAVSINIGHSESLQDAWVSALNQNYLLQASQKSAESAALALGAAKAARMPKLRLNSGYTVLDNAPASLSSGYEIPVGEDEILSCQAQVVVPVYTHFLIKRQVKAAESDMAVSDLEEKVLTQDIKQQVAEAYLSVLRSIEGAKVSESHEQSLSAHAQDVKNLYDEGLKAISDLLSARVALADAKQTRLQAKNRRDLAESDYNRLLVRPLDSEVTLDPVEFDMPLEDLDQLKKNALENRLELRILSKKEESLKLKSLAVKSATGPQVTLSGGYDYNENKYQAHEGVWAANVNVSWDIFDGNVSRLKSRSMTVQSKSIADTRKDFESVVLLQVRQAFLKKEESEERIKVATEALAQAEENLNVARNRYQEGVGTNVEVLDAESFRTLSKSNYYNAYYDVILSKIRLIRAIGML